MASSPVLDDLIETFIEDLNDKQRQNVIDKLKRESPEAAKLLQSVWKTQRNSREMKKMADELIDTLNK